MNSTNDSNNRQRRHFADAEGGVAPCQKLRRDFMTSCPKTILSSPL